MFRKIGSFRGDSALQLAAPATVNQCLMQSGKRSVKLERTTEKGRGKHDTDCQRTENPNSMPIMDRIALDKCVDKLPPGYRNRVCFARR